MYLTFSILEDSSENFYYTGLCKFCTLMIILLSLALGSCDLPTFHLILAGPGSERSLVTDSISCLNQTLCTFSHFRTCSFFFYRLHIPMTWAQNSESQLYLRQRKLQRQKETAVIIICCKLCADLLGEGESLFWVENFSIIHSSVMDRVDETIWLKVLK